MRLRIRQVAPDIGPGTGVGNVAFNLEREWLAMGVETERFTMRDAHGSWIPQLNDGLPGKLSLAARVVWFSTVGTVILRRQMRTDVGTVTICHNDALAGQIYVNHGLVMAAMRARGHLGLRMARNPLHLFTYVRDSWRYGRGHVHARVVNLVREEDRMLHELFPNMSMPSAVIGNGVDTQGFKPPTSEIRTESRSKLKVKSDDFVILFVGHEHARKGLEILIEALADLPLNMRLVIVGGDERSTEKSRAFAKALGVATRTQFIGAVADPREYLCAADLLGHPSAYESYSLAILEALAMGLPVVSTRVGCATDVLVNGKNGYLIERTAEAVCTAIRKAANADRAQMRAAARETALQHTWTQAAERYLALARQVMPSSATPTKS